MNKLKLGAGALIGAAVTGLAIGRNKKKSIHREENIADLRKTIDKLDMYYYTLIQWIRMHHGMGSIQSYCEKNGYKRIAIYGFGEMGVQLVDELLDSEIEIAYIVDKNPQNSNSIFYKELKFVSPDEISEPVDLFIVSAIYNYEEIKDNISRFSDVPVISLLDVIEIVNHSA